MFGFELILGTCCSLIGIFLIVLDQMRYRRAEGTVVGVEELNDEGGMAYAPKIRFRTTDGSGREFRSAMYVHRYRSKDDQTVPVRYHPKLNWLNGVDLLYYRLGAVFFFLFVGLVFLRAGIDF